MLFFAAAAASELVDTFNDTRTLAFMAFSDMYMALCNTFAGTMDMFLRIRACVMHARARGAFCRLPRCYFSYNLRNFESYREGVKRSIDSSETRERAWNTLTRAEKER